MTRTRSRPGSIHRLGWGLADQALSSLSNFAVGIIVAREVSPRDFGIFAIAFSLYTLAVSVQRSFGTDPLVVRYSGVTDGSARRAEASAVGASLVFGVVVGLVIAVGAGIFLGGQSAHLWLALAVTMPGLLLQDAWRNVFFARGRVVQALINDAVWTGLLVPAFALVSVLATPTAAWLTFAWGAAAMCASILGIWQARVLPAVRQVRSWLRENRSLWPRYLAEAALFTGTQQIYFLVIASIGGLIAVGQIKLIQIALGPVNVIVQGIGLVAVPEAVRALRRGIRRMDALVVAVSATIALGAAGWGLALGLAPTDWTSRIVGSSWLAASALLLPLSLFQIVNGANTGAFVGLRALKAARRSLSVRAIASVAQLAGAVIGVSVAGAKGASYGLFLSALLYLVLWWVAYAYERRRHLQGGARASDEAADDLPVSGDQRTTATEIAGTGDVASLVNSRERRN